MNWFYKTATKRLRTRLFNRMVNKRKRLLKVQERLIEFSDGLMLCYEYEKMIGRLLIEKTSNSVTGRYPETGDIVWAYTMKNVTPIPVEEKQLLIDKLSRTVKYQNEMINEINRILYIAKRIMNKVENINGRLVRYSRSADLALLMSA